MAESEEEGTAGDRGDVLGYGAGSWCLLALKGSSPICFSYCSCILLPAGHL